MRNSLFCQTRYLGRSFVVDSVLLHDLLAENGVQTAAIVIEDFTENKKVKVVKDREDNI